MSVTASGQKTPTGESRRSMSYSSQRNRDSRISEPGSPSAEELQHRLDVNPGDTSRFTEDFSSTKALSDGGDTETLSRRSTLRKRDSLSRSSSLRRRSSSRSSRPGSPDRRNPKSAFFLPVPTHSNPTEILANRFQAWRRLLKDYIAYFKEVQAVYENKAKQSSRLYHSINNTLKPDVFLKNGGILETTTNLVSFHKSTIIQHEKVRQLVTTIINQFNGLRNDLGTKIKEIKGLSGDFKNNLDKELDTTRRAVSQLTESLSYADKDPSMVTGKNDPYIVKLSVDRQLRKQLTEENYLHRAYLNLEGSGRELESVVVSEIQKGFETYVKLLRDEGSEMLDTAERLETQTLGLPVDHEWSSFVEKDNRFVDPKIKLRSVEDVEYPGYDHPAVLEIRAGTLERKSKYLKSYTPGWYALSPSHLHEFKTPDRNHDLTPVMSLYLRESKLGSHTTDSNVSSHKFQIKGRQTGHMHRGHSWVFRAESHDAMIAFYEDIKKLIEMSGPERDAFVEAQRRERAISSASGKESGSSSSETGLENDEADEVPYSAEREALIAPQPIREVRPEGGRFPSDIDVNRHHRQPRSSTSADSERSHGGAIHTGDWARSDQNEAILQGSHNQRENTAFSFDEQTQHQDGIAATATTHTHPVDRSSSKKSITEEPEYFERQQKQQQQQQPQTTQTSQVQNGTTAAVGATAIGTTAANNWPLPTDGAGHQATTGKETMTNTDIVGTPGVDPLSIPPPPVAASPAAAASGPLEAPSGSFPPAVATTTEDPASALDVTQPPKSYPKAAFSGTSPPQAHRQDSNFTISELHVPGEFPSK